MIITLQRISSLTTNHFKIDKERNKRCLTIPATSANLKFEKTAKKMVKMKIAVETPTSYRKPWIQSSRRVNHKGNIKGKGSR